MKIQDCLETDVELINKTMFGNGRNTNDKWDIVCVCVQGGQLFYYFWKNWIGTICRLS